MSVLTHRCRRCGHVEARHDPRERGYQPCPCCVGGTADLDPLPVLLPTWTHPGGRPEPLWAPGSLRNAGTTHAGTTCACPHCRTAALDLT